MALGSIGTGFTPSIIGGSASGNPFRFLTDIFGGGTAPSQNIPVDDLDLSAFQGQLNTLNPQFFNAQFGGDRLRGIADLLEQRGRGTAPRDPAFERFRESQFNIFEQGAEQERQNVASNLARRGLGSSSVGLNQLANVDRNLALRREALGSQLGMQELGRQDQALLQSAGVLGQAGMAEEARLNAITSGLENLLAVPTLQVAQNAAILGSRLPPERRRGPIGNILGGLF